MAAVQTTYATSLAAGVPGQPANMENSNRITRTASGNISFGMPVVRVGDHNCAQASAETLEIAGAAAAGNTGAATIGSLTAASPAKVGVYTATAIVGGSATASKWRVEDPDGLYVGTATGATAFSAGGIGFTIADPGTDPAVGDAFNITVSASEETDNLDILGISLLDRTLVHTTPDRYEQYDNVAIMSYGSVFVTCGATVAAGDDVFWNTTSKRFTNTATDVRIQGWKFDAASSDGSIVQITRR